jgi:hypothetical protein
LIAASPSAPALQKIAGFERSAYARLNGRIVWAGQGACTDHPRHAWQPWQPPAFDGDARALAAGALVCLLQLAQAGTRLGATATVGAVDGAVKGAAADIPAQAPSPAGLLAWLLGQELPFPLRLAKPRFDAVRTALLTNDAQAFEAAALRVLGLGPGLTPSGDDFLGAIFFALAHAPRPSWLTAMPAMHRRVMAAAERATNPISAALLEDLMAGASYRALHEVLAALQSGEPHAISQSCEALLRVGASSGADMLAGLLLALTTHPDSGLVTQAESESESESRPSLFKLSIPMAAPAAVATVWSISASVSQTASP